MRLRDDSVPLKAQRGGSAGPRTWLVLALLLAGLMSAAMNVRQYRERLVMIEAFKQLTPSSPADDADSAPHAVAEADSGELNDGPCNLSWTLCWHRT